MPYFEFIWTDEIIAHLREHGITRADFEFVMRRPTSKGISRTTKLPLIWGRTRDGRYIMVVYEQIDAITVLPVTAYVVPEPR